MFYCKNNDNLAKYICFEIIQKGGKSNIVLAAQRSVIKYFVAQK